jgi:chromosome segregation ATPase
MSEAMGGAEDRTVAVQSGGVDPRLFTALERVGDHIVDATRAELGSLTDALSDATSALADIHRKLTAAQVSIMEGDSRWESRVRALEDRFTTMEEGLRQEIERTRSSVKVLDLMASEFRTTMGDTRNLSSVASSIADRLDEIRVAVGTEVGSLGGTLAQRIEAVLRVLESADIAADADRQRVIDGLRRLGEAIDGQSSVVTGAVERIAGRVDSRLDEDLAALRQRLDELANAVDGVVAGTEAGRDRTVEGLRALGESLQTRTTAIASGVELLANHVDQQLANELTGVRGHLDEIRQSVLDTGGVASDERARLDERLRRLAEAIEGQAATVTTVRETIGQVANRVDEGLARIGESVQGSVGTTQAGTAAVVDRVRQVADQLGALDERLDAVGQIVTERVDARLGEVTHAVDRQHEELGPRLDGLAERVAGDVDGRLAAVRAGIDALAATLAAVGDTQPQLHGRIDELAAAIAEVRANQPDPRPALERLAEAIGAVPDPTDRIDGLAAAIADLRASQPDTTSGLDHLAGAIADVRANLVDPRPVLERLADAIGGLGDPGERLDALAAAVADLRTGLAEVPDPTGRLDSLAAALAELRTNQPDLAGRLDALAGEIAEIRTAQPHLRGLLDQLGGAVAGLSDQSPLTGRLDALAAAVADLHANQADPRPALEQLADAIGGLGDPGERLDALAAAVADLRANQADPRPALERLADAVEAHADPTSRLDGLAVAIADLQAHQPDPRPALERLADTVGSLSDPSERLDQLAAAVADLRAALPDHRPALDRLADGLAGLPDPTLRLDELAEAVSELRAGLPNAGEQLDALASALADIRAHQPDPRPALERLADAVGSLSDPSERLDQLAAAVAELRTAVPDPTERLDRLADRLEGLTDPSERLDQLAAAVAELRATVPNPSPELDRMATALSELRAAVPDPTERLDHLTGLVADVRAHQGDTRPILDQLAQRIDALTDPGERLDHLAAALADLRADLPDPRTALERLADAVGALPDPSGRLDELATAVAELRDRQPDLTPQLDALRDRLEAAARAVDETTAQRLAQVDDALRGVTASVAERLGEHGDAVRRSVDDGLRTATERLDAIHATLGSADGGVGESLTAIQARLSSLTSSLGALHRYQPDMTALLDELGDRIEAAQRAAAGGVEAATTGRLDGLAARIEAAVQDLPTAEDLRARLDEQRVHLEQLATRVEEQVGTAGGDVAAVGALVEDVRRAVLDASSDLGPRVEAVRDAVAAVQAEQPAAAEQLADLHRRMTAALDELSTTAATTRDTVTPLAEVVARSNAVQSQNHELLERLLAGVLTLRDQVAAQDPERIADVVAAVGRVREAVEAVTAAQQAAFDDQATRVAQAAGDAGDTVLEALREQGNAIQRLVRDLHARLDVEPDVAGSLEQLGAQLAAVAADVGRAGADDQLAAIADQVDAAVRGRLDHAVAELRAAVEAVPGSVAVTLRLDEIAAELRDHLDRVVAASRQQGDEVGQSVDRLARDLPARIDEQLTVLADTLAAAAHERLTRADLVEILGPVGEHLDYLANAGMTRNELRDLLDPLADRLANVADGGVTKGDVAEVVGPIADQLTSIAARTAGQLDEVARAVAALTGQQVDPERLLARIDQRADVLAAEVREAVAATGGGGTVDAVIDRMQADAGRILDALAAEMAGVREGMDQVQRVVADLEQLRGGSGGDDVNRLAGQVSELSRDLAGTREIVRVVSDSVTGIRLDLRSQESAGGLSAGAMLGTAQAAWTRLEHRLEREFDDVGHQLEQLGGLLHQAIEAMEAAQSNQPHVADQLRRARDTAASFLDSLRESGRDRRRARVGDKGPRGLGRGD